MSTHRIIIILFVAAVSTACQPAILDKSNPDDPWSYDHLRVIDTPDDLGPDEDVIAVYARTTTQGLQVRLDFMDLTNPPLNEMYLALDHKKGGVDELPSGIQIPCAWDLLIHIDSNGTSSVFDTSLDTLLNIHVGITSDQELDTWVMTLHGDDLPQFAGDDLLYLAVTTPHQGDIIDGIGPVSLDADPPDPVHLLLAFWEVMPGYTPAMALRAWDGAHSGPYGGRHGLKHLLAAAARYRVPLALMDLKAPYALSALDVLAGWDTVHALSDEGLLSLPDVLLHPRFAALPEWALARAAGDSRQMAAAFGLPESEMLYAPGQIPDSWSTLNDGYALTFYLPAAQNSANDRVSNQQVLFQSADGPVIALPSDLPAEQASRSGPTLAMRSTLLAGATISDVLNPITLGGPLHATTWGDPQAAERTFAWLSNHHWINILGPSDLAALGSVDLPLLISTDDSHPLFDAHGPTFESIYADLLVSLQGAPRNRITDLAWHAFQALLAPLPAERDNLMSLRGGYLNQIAGMIQINKWSHAPVPIVDCTVDLDFDGESECVLANETIFTIWEMDGGRMLYAFWRTDDGIHQIVGPQSQLIIGLSDPVSWFLDGGELRDPSDIAGGFQDRDSTGNAQFARYLVQAGNNQLHWNHPEGTLEKVISLTPSGFLVEYNAAEQITVYLPLLINADTRFNPHWVNEIQSREAGEGSSWEWGASHSVLISSTGNISQRSFMDSLAWMSLPEDPNQDYPPGHLLPFPLIEITIDGYGGFSILVEFN